MRRSKYTLMSNLHLETSDAGLNVIQIGAGPGLVGEANSAG